MENALKLTTLGEYEKLAAGQVRDLHLSIRLQARDDEWDSRPDMSVLFMIDVSSSMAGEALGEVLDVVDSTVERLRPTDRVGLATFARGCEEIISVREATAEQIRRLRHRLRKIRALKWTNFEAALKGVEAMMPERREGERQVALMLSDGWPSVGDRSSSGLVQIVEAWDGISLSTLGFAKHHHPDLMELLSATSGGRYHFVSDPLVCEYEFASALGTQQAMVASEVEVFVEPGDDVEFVETLGLEPTDVDEGTARIDLIDFTGKMQQITVPRLKVSPKEETDQFELAKITVRYYDEALQKGVTLQDKVYLNVADGPGPRNADVVADVLIAGAKQVRRRARRLADAGEQGGAGAEIAAMIDRIESAPTYRGKAGSPLNELCEDLREEREIISDGDEEKRRDYTFNNSNDRTRYTANRGVARYSLRPSTSAPEVVTLHIEEGTRAGEAVTVYDTNIIGRSSTVDIVFDDDAISRRHAQVLLSGDRPILRDLGSQNGTYVNDKPVRTSQVLINGDRIRLGDVVARVWVG